MPRLGGQFVNNFAKCPTGFFINFALERREPILALFDVVAHQIPASGKHSTRHSAFLDEYAPQVVRN